MKINENLHLVRPSASIALMDKARQMKAAGKNVISLAGGEPDFDTPKAIVDAAEKAIRDGKTHYTTGRGILPLRERIVQKLYCENGVKSNPTEILVTPGGKYAIYISLYSFVNPGDEVLIMDPSWLSYEPIVNLVGGKAVRIPLSCDDNYKITKEVIEDKITEKTKFLILNSPNNPTGRVITPDEVDAIREVLNHHDIMLISDEVYETIVFDGRRNISIASYEDVSPKVITINSFSKCVAMTGWRLGYIQASQSVIDTIYMAYQHMVTCVSEFSQIAAITALDCTAEMEMMRESYERRRNLLIDELVKSPSIKCSYPEGAFYAWCKIESNGRFTDSPTDYLLENAGVVVVNGKEYGLGADQFVRMCFAASETDIIEASRRIVKALE